MKILFAEKCAWRAMYLHTDRPRFGRNDVQVAYIGFDPQSHQPTLFGGLFGHSFRFTVPHISWPLAARSGELVRHLYGIQGRILHAIDGRF